MDNLTNPSLITEYMKKNDFFFKKNLGQNFLRDENIARKIVEALELRGDETVLEIGPGFGALTQYLLEDASEVIAVEIDPFAIKTLSEALGSNEKLTVVGADILKLDINDVLCKAIKEGRKIKAISNLPYYITSSVILKLIENVPAFESIIVMIQKEVAQRLSAEKNTKEYSGFTVLLNYFADAEKLFDVSHTNFIPAPKVDSAVVKITPHKVAPVEVKSRESFVATVKAGFSMRRKTLLNCISSGFKLNKEKAAEILLSADIQPIRRAETLSLSEFGKLSDALYEALNV